MNRGTRGDSTLRTQVLKTMPFHLYMTQTQSFANPTTGKAAGQIGMGGTKQSEEISTGKDIYVLTRGRWIDMQTSFAAMEQYRKRRICRFARIRPATKG